MSETEERWLRGVCAMLRLDANCADAIVPRYRFGRLAAIAIRRGEQTQTIEFDPPLAVGITLSLVEQAT